MKKNARNKINEMITQKMIERIAATGSLPWRKPWVSQDARPQNLISRKPYRGVNAFLLHMMGYAQPYFLTMKQANQLGGKVRKGEHSMPVVFWKFVEPDEASNDPDNKGYAMLRYYHVFNVAQCEGIPEGKIPKLEKPDRDICPITEAEQLIEHMPNKPTIEYGRTYAAYNPLTDTVHMPPQEMFLSDEAFFATCFHEILHSTGHQSRLARKGVTDVVRFGSHEYSKEELVAEMGAAFLCGHCGILPEVEDNSAAYLKGWLERLKADPSMLVTAGQQAQKAYDYIVAEKLEPVVA
ncbi:ArdC family protein [Pontiella sulfatireligans]|uniref:DNA primase TraC n=1 Tax=Pontiella sulfatireligans TaxID=2750658 RepID=A0A6C2USS9_9BACT|nr:zincin-like metallopeptidase domain-containing protein [Pontiella sulfatireligans]VGO21956.1 DNA primase TraC [Pontiella sulfatireligans]